MISSLPHPERTRGAASGSYADPYLARNVDFLITYEHKVRELETMCLVKNELERRGYTVGFTTTYDERRMRFIDRRSPGVVLVPALYNDSSLFAFVYWIAGACRKVVNMQWEQALTNQDESDPSFFQNPKGAARYAVHICWGEEPKKRLMRAGVPDDKAVIVGPPQMDALRPEMRNMHMSREQLAELTGLDSSQEWVLFTSSFSFVSMSAEEFETELKSIGPSLREFVEVSVTSQKAILAWFVQACQTFPDKIFIYRPHPSESAAPHLRTLAAELPNFRVISEFSVRQWIVCADQIFTWYSTSAAEAFCAGKSCGVLRPVPISKPLDVSIFRGTRMIERVDQFLDAVAGRDLSFSLDPDLVARYFAVDPACPSYIKICDLLEEVLRTNRYDMPPISQARATYYYLQRIRHRAFHVAKDILSLPVFRPLRPIGWLGRKIENHESLMHRMRTHRPRSFATVEELVKMDSTINQIRATDADAHESCLSSS
jgi:surface carbohydrate biosynthesis protein